MTKYKFEQSGKTEINMIDAVHYGPYIRMGEAKMKDRCLSIIDKYIDSVYPLRHEEMARNIKKELENL